MNLFSKFLVSIAVFLAFFPAGSSLAFGSASLFLTPGASTVSAGQTTKVAIGINTGGAAITGADVILTFDPNILSVTNLSWGNLFGENQPNPSIDNTIGKIILHPTSADSFSTYTGTGTLATVTFSGKASGISNNVFTCNLNTTQNDSNIWANGDDIINCAVNTPGKYTVGTGRGAVLAATAAPSPLPTTIPTQIPDTTYLTPTVTVASTLPEAGTTGYTIAAFLSGILFIGLGVKLILVKSF